MSRSAMSSTVVAAMICLLFQRIDRRIGEEADHGLAARLAPELDLRLLRRVPGSAAPTSLKLEVALAGRRQRSDILRQQRQRLVDLERADHEEREIGGVGEALPVERDHLLAVERRRRRSGVSGCAV